MYTDNNWTRRGNLIGRGFRKRFRDVIINIIIINSGGTVTGGGGGLNGKWINVYMEKKKKPIKTALAPFRHEYGVYTRNMIYEENRG